MKTSTSYRLKMIERALEDEIAVNVSVRHGGDYAIKHMTNVGHSVLFTLAKQGGFITCDPDDIVSVWVPKLPTGFGS